MAHSFSDGKVNPADVGPNELRATIKTKMDAMLEGDLAKTFRTGEQKLRPIIFSHGLAGSKRLYVGLMKDLASHGYLVLAVDHQDGTCSYTSTTSGKELFYKKAPFYDKDLRVS